MAGYWIAQVDVKDQDAYKDYASRGPAVIKSYDGKILARGGARVVMSGPDVAERVVIIEFPSLDRAVECYKSSDYQAAKKFLDAAGGANVMIVEGVWVSIAPAGYHRLTGGVT